mgnify:CR=1 FL=1
MPDKSWCKKAKVFLKPGMICDILETIAKQIEKAVNNVRFKI